MLKIGWATRSITPERPVMLHGQMHVRVSQGIENPVIVTALALERGGEAVIFIACDLVSPDLQRRMESLIPRR